MPLSTATPARIRRVRREASFARYTNPAMLALRGDALDGYGSIIESFWDNDADAQLILNERAAIVGVERRREAIETETPFGLGSAIALTPRIPRVRLIDRASEFDRVMMIKGVSIDLGTGRNSIEAIGGADVVVLSGPGSSFDMEGGSDIILMESGGSAVVLEG